VKRRALLSALLVVACGALGALWYLGHLDRFGFGSTPAIRNARARAAGYPNTVPVQPYGLVARVPSSFVCKHRFETSCRAPGELSNSVEWSIKPAQGREDPRKLVGDDDIRENVSISNDLVGRVTLAGFEGFVVSWRLVRGAERGCDFRGWFQDPTRGLLRLDVKADLPCSAHPDVLGVILSTREADPKTQGPARSWPDDAARAVQAKLAEHFDVLSDDQAPAFRWVGALGEIVAQSGANAPMAGEALRARTAPSVSELAKRRIETLTHGGSIEQLETAWTMAGELVRWDPPIAVPMQRPIAERARQLTLDAGTANTRDARRSRGLDCKITDALSRDQPGSSRAVELSRVLAPAGLLELHASDGCAEVLWRHRKAPEVAKQLDAWHDPKNIPVPADLDYLDLAEFAKTRFEKEPLLRRHVLAMLENESAGGRLTVRGKNYSVDSKHRGFGTYEHVGWGLPPDGTTIPLRVCDIYAIRFANGFVPYAPLAKRDEWIRDIIASLRKAPSAR